MVLLHDFPEFLCDHHYNFCDVIPPNCIQVAFKKPYCSECLIIIQLIFLRVALNLYCVLLFYLQMRNLILSAFPRNMRLPDPFTPNLKVSEMFKIMILVDSI